MSRADLRAVRFKAANEDGQALVLAIAILVVGLLLALGAAAYALNAGQASNHDEHLRGAQQAADAGVQATMTEQAGSAALGYSVTPTSLGNLLTCTLPEVNAGVVVGTIAVAATNGQCAGPVNSNGTTITNPWLSLSNGNNYEDAFFPNLQPPVVSTGLPAGYSPGGLGVEFPEVVSIGCNTTANTTSSSGATDCLGGASGAAKYARDLAILDPTGPLQAIEAGNNVYLQGALSLSNSLPVVQNLLSALGLSNIVSGLSCALLPTTCKTYLATILDGNISAGNDVQVPQVLLGVNTDASISSLLTNIASLNLGAITSLVGTVVYGNTQSTNVTPNSSGQTYIASGSPLAEIANQVHATGPCTAGNPSTTCTLKRPTFTVSSTQIPTTAGTGGAAGNQLNVPAADLTNGDLSLSSGTLSIPAGTYFFCNVNITGTATIQGPSTGSAQIFVLQTGASQCPANQGNFIVTPGVNAPTGLQSTLNGVTNAVAPSSVQIYVAGNASDALVPGNATPPTTTVTIGNSASLTQAMVVYAPRSNVSISTSAAFVGSVIGWNVTLSAVTVLQDLNLGNYPLASIINGIKLNQFVECDNSVTQLAASTSTNALATDTAGCT